MATITDCNRRLLGTIVNYACHPTTLAWQNTLISPDYVGALRQAVEEQTGAPCVFLQGASGDLGPREAPSIVGKAMRLLASDGIDLGTLATRAAMPIELLQAIVAAGTEPAELNALPEPTNPSRRRSQTNVP